MLTPLRIHHGAALERFLSQFDDAPDTLHGYFPERSSSVESAVELLDAWSDGRLLRDGWVPCTTRFWEIDGELAGVINIRHELSEMLRVEGGNIGYSVAPSHRGRGVATQMLGAALELCAELGLERALVTAHTSNVASWKAAERNGAVLEREGAARDGHPMRWYWIGINSDH